LRALSQSIGVAFSASAAEVLGQVTTSQTASQAKRPRPNRTPGIFQPKTIPKALTESMNLSNWLQYKRSLKLMIDRQYFWVFYSVQFI
jgi:hypothetical protein